MNELPASDMIVPAPVIVVEVVSPSSGGRDSGIKLAGYFRVPSVAHYLIVDPEHETVIHHRRDDERGIATCILGRNDTIDLTPPGIRLPVARCFARD
ncbi:MAG: Uma2 family endonuclease [Pseudomonadota bacterium]